MGKSEVNPYAMTDSTSSSSSDSEHDFAAEEGVCDGHVCTSGGDEAQSSVDECPRRGRGRGGRPWARRGGRGGGMHPMMWMMMMGGPPQGGRRGCPAMQRAKTPEGSPRRTERRCRSAPVRQGLAAGPCGPAVSPVGPSGPAHGTRGFKCGPPRGGPFMRKRFWKHMMSNPEFWQRMSEKYAQDGPQDGPQDGHQDEATLAEDFSKMEVNAAETKERKEKKKCGKKCHGKRQEKWRRFLQHMFEEMNLHAPTESEGAEGNLTDECSKETKQPEAAQDEKKVHFGDDEYFEDKEAFPWGRPRRFCQGGPWARHPECGEVEMEEDPRMRVYAGPRLGYGRPHHGPPHHGPHGPHHGPSHHGPHHHGPHHHGHQGPLGHHGPHHQQGPHGHPTPHGHPGPHGHHGMMFRGPRAWMFRHMMMNQSTSDETTSGSDGEKMTAERRRETGEKRRQFRRAVRDLGGVRPWMYRILARQIYGKNSDAETGEDEPVRRFWNQKKEKYLQILKEIGAYPWMFRVLANQQNRNASKDSPPEEAAAAAEKGPGRCERREMFQKRAKQMGWTSDSEVTSDGEALTDGEGEKKEEKERRRGDRQKMRRVMREMGWMPWMMMGRGRHHQHHHHDNPAESVPDAEKSENEQQNVDMKAKRKEMKTQRQEKIVKFRELVQEIGVQPWMFRSLASELFGSRHGNSTDAENGEAVPGAEKDEQREKYMRTLRELGAYPWMFRVLVNQRARSTERAPESESESPLEGAAAAVPEQSPERPHWGGGRRKMFRKFAKQMGWTSDSEGTSDGEALTDGEGENKEEKEKGRGEKQKMRRVMREMGWMPWMMMGRGRHHHHRHHDNPEDGAPHGLGGRHHHHSHLPMDSHHFM